MGKAMLSAQWASEEDKWLLKEDNCYHYTRTFEGGNPRHSEEMNKMIHWALQFGVSFRWVYETLHLKADKQTFDTLIRPLPTATPDFSVITYGHHTTMPSFWS